MSQSAVFNDAAVMLGLNPLDYPPGKFPCVTCPPGMLHHYSELVICWAPADRGFCCTDCFWRLYGESLQNALGPAIDRAITEGEAELQKRGSEVMHGKQQGEA